MRKKSGLGTFPRGTSIFMASDWAESRRMYRSRALGDPNQGGLELTASTHQFEFTSSLRAMHAKKRPHFFRDENSFTYR
jgi:hypothetical protein